MIATAPEETLRATGHQAGPARPVSPVHKWLSQAGTELPLMLQGCLIAPGCGSLGMPPPLFSRRTAPSSGKVQVDNGEQKVDDLVIFAEQMLSRRSLRLVNAHELLSPAGSVGRDSAGKPGPRVEETPAASIRDVHHAAEPFRFTRSASPPSASCFVCDTIALRLASALKVPRSACHRL